MSLGEMIVKIGADVSDFNKAITEIDKGLQKSGKAILDFGKGLSVGVSAPLAAAGGAAIASAISVGGYADELLDLVDQTGASATAIQEWRQVAMTAGVETDTLAEAAIKLTTQMQGSGEQTKQLAGALARLGLSATDSTGELLSMDDLLPAIIGKLQGMDDVTQRNVLAADIFGRSWAELAPVLSLGAGEMEAARKRAHELGLVLGDDALAAADEFRLQMDELKGSAVAIKNEFGVAVIPVVSELASLILDDVVPALHSAVRWFDDLSPATKKTAAVVGGLVAATGPLLVAFGSVLKYLPAIKLGLAALTGPFGALAAAVTAGALVWSQWGYGIQKIVRATVDFVKEHLLDRLKWVIGRVIDVVLGPLDEMFAFLWEKIGRKYVPGIVESIRTNFGKLDEWMSWPAEQATGMVMANFTTMATTTTRLVTEMSEETKKKFEDMNETLRSFTHETEAAGKGVRQYLNEEAKEAYLAQEKLKDEFVRMGGTLTGFQVPLKKVKEDNDNLIESFTKLARKLVGEDKDGLVGAVGTLADAFLGEKYTNAISGVLDGLGEAKGIAGAVDTVIKAIGGDNWKNAVADFVGDLGLKRIFDIVGDIINRFTALIGHITNAQTLMNGGIPGVISGPTFQPPGTRGPSGPSFSVAGGTDASASGFQALADRLDALITGQNLLRSEVRRLQGVPA